MGNFAAKTMFENPRWTARGYETTQIWEVYPDTDGLGTFDPNGYVDGNTVLTTAYPTTLPQVGDPEPFYGLCADVRVSEVKSRTCVMVAVIYRSFGLFTGGPRDAVTVYGDTRYINLPVWNLQTDGTVQWWVENDKVRYPRTTIVRVETKFLPNNQVLAVQNAVAANAGTIWTFSGLQYILSDRTHVSFDGGTNTRADYAFEHACAIPFIPAGSLYENGVDIPALPPLYNYASRPNPTLSSLPPIINAVPPNVTAVFGGPPGLPALPGIP